MLYFLNKQFTADNLQDYLNLLECQRCGKCCTGELDKELSKHGAVLLAGEPQRLAKLKHLTTQKFIGLYCERRHGEIFMRLPCTFLTPTGCSIWENKAEICRQFPFNQTYLHKKSGVKYMTVADTCPAGVLVGEKYGAQNEVTL